MSTEQKVRIIRDSNLNLQVNSLKVRTMASASVVSPPCGPCAERIVMTPLFQLCNQHYGKLQLAICLVSPRCTIMHGCSYLVCLSSAGFGRLENLNRDATPPPLAILISDTGQPHCESMSIGQCLCFAGAFALGGSLFRSAPATIKGELKLTFQFSF
jgi:hypothetical protein